MHCIVVVIVAAAAESITLVARPRLLQLVHGQRLIDHVFLEEGVEGGALLILQSLHLPHLGAGLAFPRHGSSSGCDGRGGRGGGRRECESGSRGGSVT